MNWNNNNSKRQNYRNNDVPLLQATDEQPVGEREGFLWVWTFSRKCGKRIWSRCERDASATWIRRRSWRKRRTPGKGICPPSGSSDGEAFRLAAGSSASTLCEPKLDKKEILQFKSALFLIWVYVDRWCKINCRILFLISWSFH